MLGIRINKYLRELLLLSEEVINLVEPDNIKAMVLSPTTFPFISYCRVAINTEYDKGFQHVGSAEEEVEVNLAIVSEDYEESINIAAAVRKALEFKKFKDEADNIYIDSINLTGASEDMHDDVYVQYMSFNINIQTLT